MLEELLSGLKKNKESALLIVVGVVLAIWVVNQTIELMRPKDNTADFQAVDQRFNRMKLYIDASDDRNAKDVATTKTEFHAELRESVDSVDKRLTRIENNIDQILLRLPRKMAEAEKRLKEKL